MSNETNFTVHDINDAVPGRRTFRQRISGLMDIILMRLDEDTTERHELANLKTSNLLGAATSLVDALESNQDSELISGTRARFLVESGPWDQTATLERLAAEHDVACRISNDGRRTTVDLAGATRASVVQFTNAVINQVVNDLIENATLESAG